MSVYFFQKLMEGKSTSLKVEKLKPLTFVAICILNFLIGFAVVMGGIKRTNSWHIFTNLSQVLEDALNVIYSQDLLILSIGAGVLANLTYFFMAETVATWGKKLLIK